MQGLIMFALIAILIWASGHLFVGWSLGRFIRHRRWLRWSVWTALGLHFGVTLGAMSLRRVAPDAAWMGPLQWVAFVGMGLFVLLFAFCLIRDLIIFVAHLYFALRHRLNRDASTDAGRRAAPNQAQPPPGTDASIHPTTDPIKAASPQPAPDSPADPSRRALFQGVLNTGMVSLSVAATGYGFVEATKIPDVRRVDVPIKGLAAGLDGFQIVQLSDIHVGPTIKRDFVQGVVDRVKTLNPDLIAYTGDLIDGYVPQLRADVAPLSQLSAPYGKYYVTGNHEYYWDAPGWCEEVSRLGWTVLNNAHTVVDVNDAQLLVGGVTDYSAARHMPAHKTDPHKAIAGAPPVDFRLLLAHQPKSVWEAAKAGFDMQISGHTHGGQFWPGNVLVGYAHPFSRGLDDYEGMKIYVSCGTGYWGPPLRLGAPSEITLLTLKSV